MTRTPQPGEVWTSRAGEERTIVNVYPDAVTFTGVGRSLVALTLDEFVGVYSPPAPVVDMIEELWFEPLGFYVADLNRTQPPDARRVGTIAAMSDGTFRFEASS